MNKGNLVKSDRKNKGRSLGEEEKVEGWERTE